MECCRCVVGPAAAVSEQYSRSELVLTILWSVTVTEEDQIRLRSGDKCIASSIDLATQYYRSKARWVMTYKS